MPLSSSPIKTKNSLDEAAKKLEGRLRATLFAFAADITSVDSIAALHESVVRRRSATSTSLVQSAGITGAQGLFHEIDRRRLDQHDFSST